MVWLFLKDKKTAIRAIAIRNREEVQKKFYWHDVNGGNFRLSNLQAALGLAQLKKLITSLKLEKKI